MRIGADDATGRENLARDLIRAPFSGEKIAYNAAENKVVCQTKSGTGANGNYETFDPLDFLAAITSHIPNRSEHLVTTRTIQVCNEAGGGVMKIVSFIEYSIKP